MRREILGELTDWRQGIALPANIEPPPGVYQYKILVDGRQWKLDPTNPRTRSAHGIQNSVLGGAPEPWLFAPVAPWLVALAGGGLRVLVGVRGSAIPAIAWSEGGARALDVAFREDEHVFYSAVLPVSAASVAITITAPDAPPIEATWARPPAALRLPNWWSRAVIYGIFVDRFRPAEDRTDWERAPIGGAAAGGHLDGIRRSLDELADLGVNVLYLTPVHIGASAHRYDIVDPQVVDPLLGGEDAYAALIADAKQRGMRVIQDVSFAHAGRGFPPYEDVLLHRESSRFAGWFQWKDGGLAQYGKRSDAPLFDLEHPEVQALAVATIEKWARRGVAGLRLDMTAEIPIALGQRLRRRFRELVPDGVVFGELVPQHAWRWRNAGVIDAATDFDFHGTIGELATGALDADVAFERLRRASLLRGDDPRSHAVRFLSTHDHVRLATKTPHLACAEALLFTLPGIPLLLYGEEHALHSDDPNRELEDVWPDRMPMSWGRGSAHRAALRALIHARASSEALRSGATELLFADASTLVFRRSSGQEIVDVALNFASHSKELELEDDEHPGMTLLAGSGSVQGARVMLPPFSAAIARRSSASALVGQRNLLLRDRDMTLGAPVAAARPSRFFFAVTERCNLRCEHCITHAPARTKDGSARTMTPAVLTALAPHFAFADYFAFVHGGESLTAPIFFDVLAAIASARAGQPYVAHLLTNGLLLDVPSATRLVEHGVSSISVSLDGATAATNDAIRTGGRFDVICKQLAHVLAWRRERGVDLRIGISTVVLAQNVDELDALVDLGAALGVDWIKLEEGVPATPFAKRSLVAPSAPTIRRAIDRGRALGLVMIDHTVDRPVWRCLLDGPTSEFLEADEYANRAVIHPCRTPWETACIEPNGDIRARDFYGPILGNAVESPLDLLWNAPAAQQTRQTAAKTRLCAPAGPVTCLEGDPIDRGSVMPR